MRDAETVFDFFSERLDAPVFTFGEDGRELVGLLLEERLDERDVLFAPRGDRLVEARLGVADLDAEVLELGLAVAERFVGDSLGGLGERGRICKSLAGSGQLIERLVVRVRSRVGLADLGRERQRDASDNVAPDREEAAEREPVGELSSPRWFR